MIHPESLQEVDTEVSSLIEFKEYKETLQRARDVVKKSIRKFHAGTKEQEIKSR